MESMSTVRDRSPLARQGLQKARVEAKRPMFSACPPHTSHGHHVLYVRSQLRFDWRKSAALDSVASHYWRKPARLGGAVGRRHLASEERGTHRTNCRSDAEECLASIPLQRCEEFPWPDAGSIWSDLEFSQAALDISPQESVLPRGSAAHDVEHCLQSAVFQDLVGDSRRSQTDGLDSSRFTACSLCSDG